MGTVLIAEDDEAQRSMLAEVLRANGMEVIEVGDGAEAVTQAIDKIPDIVLLDINLPAINGLEVAELLTKASSTAHIPIIGISGLMTGEIRRKAMAAGCSNYLNKPFTPMALVAEVKHWLVKKR